MMFGIDRIAYSNLKVEIEDLKNENVALRCANDAYKMRYEGEMANSSFAIDWDAMKVFSVERNFSATPTTILGYMLSEPAIHTEGEGGEPRITYKDVVREWTLHCSPEKHEQLVKEFIEWKARK